LSLWTSKDKSERACAERRKKAQQLRAVLTKLGVTFIKLGQFLSVRRDILPLEFVEELSLLQDKVPPFAFVEVRTTVEHELEAKLNEIFCSFESEPMASASIGQVHKATLKNGQAVAVKVQRANLAQVINQDLAFLRSLFRAAKAINIKGDWDSWFSLIDEFGQCLLAEIDYLQEGRNADHLRQVLRNFPAIIIPRIFWRYTTRRVITEELCEGVKIDKISLLKDIDLKRLAKQIVDAYLEQMMVHGYFHADPHAGNLAVTNEGKLIIYDFGMVSHLSEGQQQGMIKLIHGVIDNNISGFIEALEQMGIIRAISRQDKEYLLTIIEPIWVYCHTASTEEIDLLHLEKEINVLLRNRYFQLPANLAYLIRMIVALEAIVRTLNPNFNFIRAASPYFRALLVS